MLDCNISWPLDEDVTNAYLEQIMFPSKYKGDRRYAEPNYPYVHIELAKPGETLTLLREEYCARCHDTGIKPYNEYPVW